VSVLMIPFSVAASLCRGVHKNRSNTAIPQARDRGYNRKFEKMRPIF
jgi:hypothetical protein